ncbi:MAG: GAF domain-containing protein [Oscillospiraceae bacterium]|nr:GAF domain-containing protein [Oscillospiraceae bacterium]
MNENNKKSADQAEFSQNFETTRSILNNIDAMIYVTVPDTGEILFINEHMKQHYGLKGDIVGQTCYKVLQDGMDSRCEFCPCFRLDKSPDDIVVWEEHSSLTGRTYKNTDRYINWADGKKVHLQHSVDITDMMETQVSLKINLERIERRDNLLQAVNQAAALLLNVSDDDDIISSIATSLELVGNAINADRVHIWKNELIDGKMHFFLSYTWVSEAAKNLTPVPLGDRFSHDRFDNWKKTFMKGKCINGIVSQMSQEYQDFFNEVDIKSVTLIPLFHNEQLWGMFSIDDCTNERTLPEKEISILRSISLMMVSSISRYSLITKMNEAGERSMLMLDSAPLCAQIWDRNLNTVDCNEAAVKLYGFKDKQEYAEKFITHCNPEYQPDGRRSDEKAVALVNEAFEKGSCIFDWMHKMPYNDTPMPADVVLVRVKYGGNDVVIGYTRDMREHYNMMKKIAKHDEMLWAVNQIAVLLLNTDIKLFKTAMQESMRVIAYAVNVDRVYIWKNHNVDGQLYASQLFQWSEKGTVYSSTEKFYTYNELFPGWEEDLSRGEYKNGPVSQMSQELQELLKPAGIVSIVVVPIFMENQFWGFIGFDDFYKERSFTAEEEAILNSASLLFANAFVRNEMIVDMQDSAKQLHEQDKLLRAVNQASTLLLTTKEGESIEASLKAGMEIIGNSIAADRIHIWQNMSVDGGVHFVRIYEWFNDIGSEKFKVPDGVMTPFSKMAEWEAKFKRKEYVGGCPVSKMSPEENEYFTSFDVKSVILIPLFLDEHFWGVVSLDDCISERYLSEEEISILRSISLIMASAINRNALIEKRTRELAMQTATMTTLFDAIPDLIFTKDKNLRFMHFNKVFMEHSGKTKEELIGKNDEELFDFPAEMVAWYKEKDLETMHGGIPVTVDEIIPHVNGTNPLFETTKVPLVLDGESIGILGISRDITERKEKEQKAKEQLEYTKTLTDALAKITKSPTISTGDLKAASDIIAREACKAINTHRIGMWYIAEDKSSLKNISCYDSNLEVCVIQEDFDLITRPKYIERLQSERSVATNTSEECNEAFGEYGSLLCATLDAPIRIDGKLIGVVCIEQEACEEYPDKREWMIEEQNFSSSLADLMALAISSHERVKAQTEAEMANKSKSTFLANMSHEIRTPMNAILGTTEILFQYESLPVEIEEGLGKIYNSGDLLLGIINDILDLSKIDAGKLDISARLYNVPSLISDSVQLNMMRINNTSVRFELHADENIPTSLIGDELRLKQILNNLLSNAFKYTEEGEVLLSVTFDKPSSSLVIKVQDTGYGMTKEQLSMLFEEYSRFDNTSNKFVEGTGLGLAITQRLIYLMNGEINVESEPGKGSLFTIKIPQETINDEVIGEELSTNLKNFRANYMTNRERRRVVRDYMPYGKVLVVDDVEPNLYVAEGLMKLYHLQIRTASSGFEAIDIIKSGNVFDVIFMDHMMPEMDGIETVKHIRDFGYTGSIVALTANAVAGQTEVFLDNGFDEFISKPIDIRHLNLILNKLVRDKQPPEVIENARLQKDAVTVEKKTPPSRLLNMETKGIDLKKGLLRYDSDEAAYIKILRSYVASIRSMLDTIKVFNEQDAANYKVRVHGIKGACLGIFADEIGKKAAALETAANEKDFDFIKDNNPPFILSAYELVENLSALLASLDDDSPKLQKAKPDTELLKKLLFACETYSMTQADEAMTEISKYKYDEDDGLVAELMEYMDNMDYSKIAERLSYLGQPLT